MWQLLTIFYQVLAPIALIAGLGFVFDRHFSLNTRSLSQVIVYLASPSLVFSSLSQSTLQTTDLNRLMGFTIVSMAIISAISGAIAWGLRLNTRLAGAFTLSVTLINAGNFGIPFITFAFGTDFVGQAVIIYVATAIVANTLGVFLASRGSASIKNSFFNIFKVPLPYALAAGLMANAGWIAVPVPVERGLSLLGNASVPLMLLVLGAQLSRTKIEGEIRLIALAAGFRLVVPSLVGIVLARIMALGTINTGICVMQTSMPTAVMAIVLAEEFGSDSKFVSSVVVVSTLASFGSLAILLTLLT